MPGWSPLALTLACLLLHCSSDASDQERPEITGIHVDGSDVVVETRVPKGLRKVVLESRSRANAGAWVPQAIQRLDGNGGDLTFRLPKSNRLEILRARAEVSEVLPASFYQGTNEFSGPPGGGFRSFNPGATDSTSVTPPSSGRAVVESDIWKITEDTVYFFNQVRGLQIINISQPDHPTLRATLSIPAAGEQMYVTQGFAVMLARDCGSASGAATVLVVDARGDVPTIARRLPVDGTIQESRLVGSTLYVASDTYHLSKPIDPKQSPTWEWGTVVTSFDLSNPAEATVKMSLWFAGWGNVISATDQFLFACIRDPIKAWQSTIQIIDISDDRGAMVARGQLTPYGQIADKFKIRMAGTVFTAVSESWNDRAQWTTVLENFSLVNPMKPAPLGSTTVQVGERLFATRFDGDRGYIVTFRRIDPLFVIDLSDPRHPRVAGEVQVPGWSTYMQPLGDRLLTIGIDNVDGWRVAVSLFDVKNPAAPRLLSRVPVGENYSWSEANYDEKAFGFVPEAGLILVPYQGYTTNGYASRVQLIDLKSDTLVARGAIDHSMVPRRATLVGDRVLSLSGRELITLDALDRDHPKVQSILPLSWRVDRVVVSGAHVIEFTGSGWDTDQSLLRIAEGSNPDHVLRELSLGKWPVLGASAAGDRLYVLQGPSDWTMALADGEDPTKPTQKNLSLSVFDLSTLPQLPRLSRVEVAVAPLGWSTSWKPIWVKPGLLVWAGGGFSYGWGFRGALDAGVGDMAIGGFWRPWFGGQGGRLLSFDVADVAAPHFTSDMNLATGDRWNFSDAFTANGLVFVSYQTTEFLNGVVPPGYVKPEPTDSKDPITGVVNFIDPPIGTWVQKDFLDVVDYEDVVNPTARKPISLPARLTGISHGGEMIYTLGPRFDLTTFVSDWNDWLAASAYDGLSAHLIDTVPMPQAWPHPSAIQGESAIIGVPALTPESKSSLETWTISEKGKWTRGATTPLGSPAQTLITRGNLLAVQTTGDVTLFDATTANILVLKSRSPFSTCLWFDITQSDGSLEQGLWAPANDYGVFQIPIR